MRRCCIGVVYHLCNYLIPGALSLQHFVRSFRWSLAGSYLFVCVALVVVRGFLPTVINIGLGIGPGTY